MIIKEVIHNGSIFYNVDTDDELFIEDLGLDKETIELPIFKEEKLKKIKSEKKKRQSLPVKIREHEFFNGRDAAHKYDEALRLLIMSGSDTSKFLSTSGMVEVDIEYAKEVVLGVSTSVYNLWYKEAEYIEKVRIATSATEVDNIEWVEDE